MREHYTCDELEGAELEDQGDLGTMLTHWEKRVFEVIRSRILQARDKRNRKNNFETYIFSLFIGFQEICSTNKCYSSVPLFFARRSAATLRC